MSAPVAAPELPPAVEQFGQRIQPLMKCRAAKLKQVA